jgi:hypothetical protein
LSPPNCYNKTIGGELAFCDDRVLGYVYYNPSAMVNCEFIMGKYGLKWANNNTTAKTAKEKINNYLYE